MAAPTPSPRPLAGELIRLSDHPGVMAFSGDGTRLAARGISTVHLIDAIGCSWIRSINAPMASHTAPLLTEHGLVAGEKVLALLDLDSGKKQRSF